MYILIGDIGNTVTKICLCAKSNLKIEKIIYINSNIIYSEFNLKKILKKILNNKKINKLTNALTNKIFNKNEQGLSMIESF